MEMRKCSKFSSKEFDSAIKSSLRQLQREKDFSDVTITCEGRQIEAHKVVLARGSRIFNNILKLNPQSHPLIFLSDVKISYLLNILDFLYQGEVSIDKSELNNFLVVARDLEVNDITEEAFKESEQSNVDKCKKQRLTGSPSQELNIDYKIKTDNKLDDFHSIVNDFKVDELEDFDQFADGDFENFKDKGECININKHTEDRNPMQDLNVDYKIKIEIEKKNSEKNERTIQDPVNERSNSHKHRLRIKDIAMLTENKKRNRSISLENDILKCGFESENWYKTESRKGNIEAHLSSVHEKIKYSCTKCDYKANTEKRLKIHVLSIHDGMKYPCSNCTYRATELKALKKHILSTHEGVTQEGVIYPCSQCNYKTIKKVTLKAHIEKYHL